MGKGKGREDEDGKGGRRGDGSMHPLGFFKVGAYG